MRRMNVFLLALLQLGETRSRGFSIHEDLLAFPQFEVVFSPSSISENDAKALVEGNSPHSTYSADFSEPTVVEVAKDGEALIEGDVGSKHVYEVMNMAPNRYLCSIPVMQPPPPENQTENELARAEEARELSRAALNGWELVNKLEDSCLYFMSGWWSYSLCKNREIVQFHAMTNMPTGQPPKPDPNSAEYVLGRVPALPASAENRHLGDLDEEPIPAELQVKGDQRYLVQKLVGGTICDLTGRERTIEVQYHCNPGLKVDRIAWIKEVTICAYLMVVNTPRLCHDVAFLPPKEKKANPITCSLIVEGEAQSLPQTNQENELTKRASSGQLQKETSHEKVPGAPPKLTVGGIVIGGRKTLSTADEPGKPVYQLENPRKKAASRKSNSERLIEMIAQAASKEEGGKVEVLSAEDLERLEISPEVVEELKQQLEEMAGDQGWKLEIVEVPGGEHREIRGYVDKEEGEEDEDETSEAGEGSEEGFKEEL
ncbi:hypothetical protein S7711_02481 [Stachybotrys chartarum IBT 7711]|uniref:Endoplasmic reticulum lectin n=1 Tax=Stachybotrys chartarum (strain CBS 109288 / IBT 7711) TaxID=1280523 RepID=A0A084B563_STACB|nr:hypothetical protein S7711_02481 [Stachybotrys chartarum IBT 7711]